MLSSVVVEERLRELRVLRLSHIRCGAARSGAARTPPHPAFLARLCDDAAR